MSLAREIHTAAQAGQADVVLQLSNNGNLRDAPAFGEGWADAAQAVFDLAQRMRLRHGRNGAWAKHLQLLQLVCSILEQGMESSGQQVTDPALEALLLRARKLQGNGTA